MYINGIFIAANIYKYLHCGINDLNIISKSIHHLMKLMTLENNDNRRLMNGKIENHPSYLSYYIFPQCQLKK